MYELVVIINTNNFASLAKPFRKSEDLRSTVRKLKKSDINVYVLRLFCNSLNISIVSIQLGIEGRTYTLGEVEFTAGMHPWLLTDSLSVNIWCSSV